MIESRTTRRFRSALSKLPSNVRKETAKAYLLFRDDPHHPSLMFKRVHGTDSIYSARISRDYRAVGTLEGNCVIWFWIGPHDEYELLLKTL